MVTRKNHSAAELKPQAALEIEPCRRCLRRRWDDDSGARCRRPASPWHDDPRPGPRGICAAKSEAQSRLTPFCKFRPERGPVIRDQGRPLAFPAPDRKGAREPARGFSKVSCSLISSRAPGDVMQKSNKSSCNCAPIGARPNGRRSAIVSGRGPRAFARASGRRRGIGNGAAGRGQGWPTGG